MAQRATESRMRLAFTLIELLIVVAIIAILAAIAVPNFLEAQVRSKVGRVQEDMRNLATALESYRVDNTKYPSGRDLGQMTNSYLYPGGGMPTGFWVLTTPVAYITSIPFEPFIAKLSPYSHYFYFSDTDIASDGSDARAALVMNWNVFILRIPPYTWGGWDDCPHNWLLRSNGPDREANHAVPYDSSNGTVSMGDIVRWGP